MYSTNFNRHLLKALALAVLALILVTLSGQTNPSGPGAGGHLAPVY
jgi:hypothetical protein